MRPGTDRHWLGAESRGKAGSAGRPAAPGFARGERNRAIHAGQYSQLVASAASSAPRRAGTGEHARLVYSHGRTASRVEAALRKVGRCVSGRWYCRRAGISCVQEALNNVKRHAGVQEAWLRLKFQGDSVSLEVEDHGKAFSPDPGHQGIGLVGMRERAELVGGTLQVLRREGGGTIVRLVVPAEQVEAHGR